MMQSGSRHSKTEKRFAPKNPLGGDLTPLQQNDNLSTEQACPTRHQQLPFAPDIAQSLINEIRKLQQIIQEKDRLIMDLEISEADKEKEQEQAHKHLRQKTRLEEKLKEENWNLEVANQDLQANVLGLNQTITKLNLDLNKALHQLRASLDQVDIIKAQQEKTTAAMDAMKVKHDHEQQLLRRNNVILHRDITQLKKRLDDTNTDLKISKAKLAIKATVSSSNNAVVSQNPQRNEHNTLNINDTTNGSDTESITLKSSSIGSNPPTIPTNSQYALEIETLKQSLGHAHRMVSSLRTNLQKEKVEKIELRRLLLDTQEAMEQLQRAPTIESNSINNGDRKPVKKKPGVNRIKMARKHGRSAKKDALAIVEHEKEETPDDGQLESLAVKTTMESKHADNDRGIILMDNYGLLSGDDNMSIDDTSSLNTDDDSGSDHRLDLSPIGYGQSLDMELNLCGLGGSFKSISSELQGSLTKRQYFDKGVNTHANFEDTSLFGQQHLIGIDSGIEGSGQTSRNSNDKWNNNLSNEYNSTDEISPIIIIDNDLVYQPSSIPTTSPPHKVLSLQNDTSNSMGTANAKQQVDVEITPPTTHPPSNPNQEEPSESPANVSHITPHQVSAQCSPIIDGESTHLCKPATSMLSQHKSTVINILAPGTGPINYEITPSIPITDDSMTPTNHIIDGISGMSSTNESLTIADDPSTSPETIPTLDDTVVCTDRIHQPSTPVTQYPSSVSPVPPIIESQVLWKSEPLEIAQQSTLVKQDCDGGYQALPFEMDVGDTKEVRSHIKLNIGIDSNQSTENVCSNKDNGREDLKDMHNSDTHGQYAALTSEDYPVKRLELTHNIQHIIGKEESICVDVSHETSRHLGRDITMKAQDSTDNIVQKEIGMDCDGHFCKPFPDMISRTEVDALVKAGIADALAQERLGKKGQEQELGINVITMAEAEKMAKNRAEEVLMEERNRTSTMLTKDEANIMARNYAEEVLLKAYNKQDHEVSTKTTSTKSLLLTKANTTLRQSNTSISRGTPKATPQSSSAPSPTSSTSSSTATATAAPSSSRFGILSGLMKLQPSISTPTKAGRQRPAPSTSSLRKLVASASTLPPHPRQTSTLGPHKRSFRQEQQVYHSGLDRRLKTPNSTPSFGTVRITETSMYSRSPSPPSLKSQKLKPQHQPLKKRSMQSMCSTTFQQDDMGLDLTHAFNSPSAPSNADLVLAITQTMIGEWMWKHTRRHVGSGISENKHKRFFWVHPYTRTLYWGNSEPGIDADEAKAKSALIERVSSIPSHDTMGASPLSLLIKTGKRDLKLTAPTLERHELWKMSLSYLLVPLSNASTMGDYIQVDPYHDTDTMTDSTPRGSTQTPPIASSNASDGMHDEQMPLQDHRSLHLNGASDGDGLGASTVATIGSN